MLGLQRLQNCDWRLFSFSFPMPVKIVCSKEDTKEVEARLSSIHKVQLRLIGRPLLLQVWSYQPNIEIFNQMMALDERLEDPRTFYNSS